jgi:hypothetical protein
MKNTGLLNGLLEHRAQQQSMVCPNLLPFLPNLDSPDPLLARLYSIQTENMRKKINVNGIEESHLNSSLEVHIPKGTRDR